MVYKTAEAMLTFADISRPKLQILCYYAYAWHITFFGKKLFLQRFWAGHSGPVCLELEEMYKEYIEEIPRSFNSLTKIITDQELRDFLTAVYDAHGTLSEQELKIMACSEEPWVNARNRYYAGSNNCYYYDEDIIAWQAKKIWQELNKTSDSCLILM